MKTFKQFTQTLREMECNFGSPSPKIKEKCYGKTVKYAMLLGKRVCAFKRRR
jgi:hypothetical protein